MKSEKRQRRIRLLTWTAIATMYRKQGVKMTEEELERLSRHVAREINNLNYRTKYNDWRFAERHRLSGLRVTEPDDPGESPGTS